jgi:superfamily II DNA or RNA helicase
MTSIFTDFHSKYHATSLQLAGSQENSLTRTLTSARVEMNPHQVNAALFALKSPFSKGALLADEVGLGKTIEAGLVISQRIAEGKRRILLIVPASLRKQWQQELQEKFSVQTQILDAAIVRKSRKRGDQDIFKNTKIPLIMSYEYAARIAEELRLAQKWDLIVFDEAHRLRNVYKNEQNKGTSKRAQSLADAFRDIPKILLTATPLQNSLLELYGLISVIDDKHFGGLDSFRTQYVRGGPDPENLAALQRRIEPVCQRTLRRQVQEAGHINFRKRTALTFDFDPFDNEIVLYERVSDFLQRKDTVSYGDRTNALVLLQVRKILGSSTFAVARYLETLIGRLREKQKASVQMTDDLDGFDVTLEEADSEVEVEDFEVIDPQRLAYEIVEIEEMLVLANSIEINGKGEALIGKLPLVLEQIVAKGGKNKAVIFTESVRTQKYLEQLLSNHGYAGKLVLLNGSNADAESRKIYNSWKERHAGTDKISGSRTADMKAALVEAFKSDEKSILISTESGAEGINLQFCSVLINYDLPWNPQRIEQRIGRIHRYGQLIDVTVVNLLNRKNHTEARIHQLLSEKFKLFDGVFGSSDEVLGSISSGLDFEKEVLDIVQRCRTKEQADAEFDDLQARIRDDIDADIAETRARVLETLDGDVVAMLHSRKKALFEKVPEYQQRLLNLARGELDGIDFTVGDEYAFSYDGLVYSTNWPVADDNDWQFFRVNDGLGKQLISDASSRDMSTEIAELTFIPDEAPFDGRVARIDALKGEAGWLRVYKGTMPTGDSTREEILCAVVADDGSQRGSDIVEKLMQVPSRQPQTTSMTIPDHELSEAGETAFEGFSARVQQENMTWLDEEELRLDRYAADIEIEIDAQIDALDVEVKDLQRQRRDPKLSMEDKLTMGRRIKKLEGEVDDLKLSKFERRKAIRKQVSDKLDEFADLLNQQPKFEMLFTLRWKVA